MRILSISALAALLLSAQPVSAASLISMSDLSGPSEVRGGLTQAGANWAVTWTQTVTIENATFSLPFVQFILSSQARWMLTRELGAGATADDVLGEGNVPRGRLPRPTGTLFDDADWVTFKLPGVLGPGTYHLILDGPAGMRNPAAIWVGDKPQNVATTLADGFSVGPAYFTNSGGAFLPSPTYGWTAQPNTQLAFALTGTVIPTPTPEPATWALMIGGFGLAGAALRRRRLQAPA